MSFLGLLRSKNTLFFKVRYLGSLKRAILPVLNSQNVPSILAHCYNSSNLTNDREVQQGSKEVLYRYKWIKQLRMVSRVKILHCLIVSGLTGPMCVWYGNGIINGNVLFATIFAATASTIGLFALSYFFRRVIGELSYDKVNDQVTISSLTFWGNRRNTEIPSSALVPMTDHGFSDKNLFHRVERYENDFVFLLNLRHGKIYNYDRLLEVLGLHEELHERHRLPNQERL
ncbi:transmembrane protein 186-like [Exaiptasia diaphana]|uniref:Transmembrane protein 186 n=1 Tax=Exaiptasia diaphana TaxID=2652724 RepID=A0A913XBA6_EXADI|nr:transmembrane protein 186-like [Exaiptasia diaphana]